MAARDCYSHIGHVEPCRAFLLPPCQIKCPIREDIQRTNILISLLPHDPDAASARIKEIGDYLFHSNPFFTVCGYVCGICELDCSYAKSGGAIRRRLLKRFLAERYSDRLKEIEPFNRGMQAKVAIIGGGPAGLMAAFELSKRGCRPVIFESTDSLGGALRLIPGYRLPWTVLDETISAIVRVAGIEVSFSSPLGDKGFDLDRFRQNGFSAIFIATGSPVPRVLEYAGDTVTGQHLHGVIYGHTFLYELAHEAIPEGCFAGRRVIVVGGGNVAFDVARSAKRLRGKITVVCLESEGTEGKDVLPADPHEVESALEEGVRIEYSRGVRIINSDGGNFSSISAPLCTRVFNDQGFNPLFDPSDTIEIPGDLLIIAVGQGPERKFLENEGLLDGRGRVAFDPLTLQSSTHETVFLGGDMLRIGYMVDAMRDGLEAAESIDRFVRGADLREGRSVEFLSSEPPLRREYRDGPEIAPLPPGQGFGFSLCENGFSLEEAISEAGRCLTCGPCASCEACIEADIRQNIPTCEVNENVCSGCGICVTACPFGAAYLETHGEKMASVTEPELCRGCGLCVSACPSCARRLSVEAVNHKTAVNRR